MVAVQAAAVSDLGCSFGLKPIANARWYCHIASPACVCVLSSQNGCFFTRYLVTG